MLFIDYALVAANTNGIDGACSSGTDSQAYSLGVTTTFNDAVVFGAVALRHRTHTPGANYTGLAAVRQGRGGSVAGIAVMDQFVPLATSLPLDGSFSRRVDWAVIGAQLRPGAGFPTNRPPTFNQDLADRTDTEGQTMVGVSSAATDPDVGDTLTYSATGLPPSVAIASGSGVIGGTIDADAAGDYSVEVTVRDDGTPSLSAIDTFIWTVSHTNRPPIFNDDLGDRTDAEGTAIAELIAAASDPDPDDTLTYDASGLPPGLGIEVTTGVISGTIGATAEGSYNVTITVMDDGHPVLSANDSFAWTVAGANRPPTFNQDLGDRTDLVGTQLAGLAAVATDPDGDALIYSADGLPTGLAIDHATGIISGRIDDAAEGTYGVTVTVVDDGQDARCALCCETRRSALSSWCPRR